MINKNLLVLVDVTHLNESSAFRKRRKKKKNKNSSNFKSVKKKARDKHENKLYFYKSTRLTIHVHNLILIT